MIKILSNNNEKNLELMSDYLNAALNTYSSYINGKTATYVTYYSRNNLTSVDGSTLGAVTDFYSNESATRYNKIENVPIYDLQSVDWTQEDTDFGNENINENEGVMLPYSITPNINDFIQIREPERTLLYRVSDVQVSHVTDKKFYKVSFVTEHALPTDIQVTSEQEMVIDNSGNFYAVEVENMNLVRRINTLYEKLLKLYEVYFLDRNQLRNQDLICPEISTFISKNKLTENTKYFFGITRDDKIEYMYYENSLYAEFENLLTMPNGPPVEKFITLCYWEFDKKVGNPIKNLNYDHIDAKRCMFNKIPNVYTSDVFSSQQIIKIVNNFLNNFYNKHVEDEKYLDRIYTLVTTLELYKFGNNYQTFLELPLIFFILDNIQKLLVTNQTQNNLL